MALLLQARSLLLVHLWARSLSFTITLTAIVGVRGREQARGVIPSRKVSSWMNFDLQQCLLMSHPVGLVLLVHRIRHQSCLCLRLSLVDSFFYAAVHTGEPYVAKRHAACSQWS
jgi:hypothetical protein